jgi:carboxypeptidase C (cathepsin A)
MFSKNFRLFRNYNQPSIIIALLFVFSILISKSYSVPDDAEKMDSIPGYTAFTNYVAYAGYLNTTSDSRKLHYVFIQNGKSNNSLPVTVWMNGGPGCSSKIGLLQ